MPTIGISQVRSLAPKPLDQYSKAFSAADVTETLDQYEISRSALRVCHFMAQILTETGKLRVLVEDMDYTAARLMVVWPSRFPTIDIAQQYAHNPEKLGNFVYGNRMGNGDAASGDGYKYRGRGLLQITGKDAYTRFGKQLGIPLAANPDLAFDPEHCLAIASAEWAVSGYHNLSCNELADRDDVYGVTHAINGGLTGISDRIAWLKKCKMVWLPAPALASRAVARENEQAADAQNTGGVHSYVKLAGEAPLLERLAARLVLAGPPACVPYFKRPRQTLTAHVAGSAGPWDIGDLCKAYNWPTKLPGGGVIGIVELDGGYTPADMDGFFQRIGQPSPSITPVVVSGAGNNPGLHIGEDGDPDIEVTMDIQVAAATYFLATGKAATIRVYWAANPPGTIAEAVRRAADECDTFSISWGADEAIWKGWATSDKDFVEDMEDAAKEAAAKGMIVFAASGDNNSSDGGSSPANVDVPSSCPSVVGCGGTTKTLLSETVWNNDPGQSSGEGTGGGYSDYFAPPAWQAGAPQIGQNPPRRMVPDVAANADPNTGYNLMVHGTYTNYGGTSAVAPLYAGLFAAFGSRLGSISSKIWASANCFTDVVSGGNGEYQAAVGPDPCSGLGVPIGTSLAALFARPAVVNPSDAAIVPAATPPGGYVPVPFNSAQAVQYGLFVDAAYSMYEADPGNRAPEPTPDFPAGYTLAAWILMRDFIIVQTNPTFYGFIAQSTTNSSQFVMAIRGTQTPEELWDDLTSIAKTSFSVPGCGQVGFGFNRIYQSLEIVERPSGVPGAAVAPRSLQASGSFSQQTASLVKRLSAAAAPRIAGFPASASVTVVGHSLGSALATLYTMENAHGDQIVNPTICTFASPRVGDDTFVAAFSALPLTSWRIVNKPDIVPMLPPEIAGFGHVGVEAEFDSSKTTQPTILCWHAMATYLSLLDSKLLPDPECRLVSAVAGAAVAQAGLAPRATNPALTPDIIKAAQASQQKWGIPASITLAQWAQESGWGKHMPPGSNNPFGIKATGNQPFVQVPTREFFNGQWVVVQAKFRAFSSIADSFDAHAQLLATSPAYAVARSFENDPAKFANALTGVYATDPNYGAELNSIISGSNLTQYDVPINPATPAPGGVAPQIAAAGGGGGAGDGNAIADLLKIASDTSQLQDAQAQAATRLLAYDGEQYPSDGCAITLSVLLQEAGINVPDTFLAIALGSVLVARGWTQIAVGDQAAGDVGSTCGQTPNHGTDHIYLVLRPVNSDEMVVADNQATTPHFRYASGRAGKSPTRFFLRAPKTGA
jgi:kumamolisin